MKNLNETDREAVSTHEIGTLIHHETEPHCCGCWIIQYGDNANYIINAVCNECGKVVDLMPMLKQNHAPTKVDDAMARLDRLTSFQTIEEHPPMYADIRTLLSYVRESREQNAALTAEVEEYEAEMAEIQNLSNMCAAATMLGMEKEDSDE